MADRRGNSIERYYASKERRQKKRKVRLYVFLTLFCLVSFLVLSLTVFFNINTFEVSGNTTYSADEIIAATGLEQKDNLFRLNKFKIADKMVVDLPYISAVNIYRKLPTTLCIEVQETKARLVAYDNGMYVLMDDTFKVLEVRKNLPTGVAYLIGVKFSETTIGQKAVFEKDTLQQTVVTLMGAIKEKFDADKVSALDVTELHALRLYYDNHRVKILLGNTERLNEKLQMAQNAISQNGLTEQARIDITSADAAYYRVLSEEELDDPKQMLLGKAKAKDDKAYNKTEQETTEQDSSEKQE